MDAFSLNKKLLEYNLSISKEKSMKKRLLLLPLFAAFLAGCEGNLFGQKVVINLPWEKKENNEKKDDKKEEEEPAKVDPIKREFGDYVLADTIEDGTYLLGVYRTAQSTMRFANGFMHEDAKGYYSFYMGTTNNTTSGAAEIEVKVGDNGLFTMQVKAPETPWDDKYIAVYGGIKTDGSAILSIAMVSDPDLETQTFTVYNADNVEEITTKVSTKFSLVDKIGDKEIKAPATLFQHEELDDSEPVRKFLGTGGTYVSIDTKTEADALSFTDYDLARLYKHK